MRIEELKAMGWKITESYTWLFGIIIVTIERNNEKRVIKVNHGIVIDW